MKGGGRCYRVLGRGEDAKDRSALCRIDQCHIYIRESWPSVGAVSSANNKAHTPGASGGNGRLRDRLSSPGNQHPKGASPVRGPPRLHLVQRGDQCVVPRLLRHPLGGAHDEVQVGAGVHSQEDLAVVFDVCGEGRRWRERRDDRDGSVREERGPGEPASHRNWTLEKLCTQESAAHTSFIHNGKIIRHSSHR